MQRFFFLHTVIKKTEDKDQIKTNKPHPISTYILHYWNKKNGKTNNECLSFVYWLTRKVVKSCSLSSFSWKLGS